MKKAIFLFVLLCASIATHAMKDETPKKEGPCTEQAEEKNTVTQTSVVIGLYYDSPCGNRLSEYRPLKKSNSAPTFGAREQFYQK